MVVDEGFTQKEMLIRIMDKLDNLERKIGETHEQATKTNGKVQLHTKVICAMIGAFVTLTGWVVYGAIK